MQLLYPVKRIFIPGPEVQDFKYRKTWTSCPGLTEPGLDWKEGGVRKVMGSFLLGSALCDHELTQSPVFKCL